MVFVNDKKFACESCIKGHRSSSCSHNDRPLFEIKKKGRPVSQCQKCRDLRQSKRVHTKCSCPPVEDEPKPELKAINKKYKRYMPTVPTLPNGLQDALSSSQEKLAGPSHPRQRVVSLLNPCPCKDLWTCTCRSADSTNATASGPDVRRCSAADTRLQALIQAASIHTNPIQCNTKPKTVARPKQRRPRSQSPTSTTPFGNKRQRTQPSSCCSADVSDPGPAAESCCVPPPAQSTASPSLPCPAFPVAQALPHSHAHDSLACTCGYQCQCPGCVEHRGKEHASRESEDCVDGACPHCVDNTAGIELPEPASVFPQTRTSSSLSPSFHPQESSAKSSRVIDQFLERAAALPLPPKRPFDNGAALPGLDPTNVVVYKTQLLTDPAAAKAFGLVVDLPKLCCGGDCGCKDGVCECGEACNGCCNFHSTDNVSKEDDFMTHTSPPAIVTSSCCAQSSI